MSLDPIASTSASGNNRQANTITLTDPIYLALTPIPTSSNYNIQKHLKEASKNWNLFYIRNENKFFKDRHWLEEFQVIKELNQLEEGKGKGKVKTLLEVGCGTGALVYPLLNKCSQLKCHCFDFSTRAIELVKSHADYTTTRVNAFTHDLTLSAETLSNQLSSAPIEFSNFGRLPPEEEEVDVSTAPDIISCIFVLSALEPSMHYKAIKTLVDILAMGGTLILRDYALYDEVQLKFHADQSQSWSKVPALLSNPLSSSSSSSSSPASSGESDPNSNDNKAWYKRGDSTLTYFFKMEEIKSHMDKSCIGMKWEIVSEIVVVNCWIENRKEGKGMERKFVQGSFKKVLRKEYSSTN